MGARRSARSGDHKGRPYDWSLVVFEGVMEWWYACLVGGCFGFPASAGIPRSLRSRSFRCAKGERPPVRSGPLGFLLSPESREVGQWSAKRNARSKPPLIPPWASRGRVVHSTRPRE